MNFYLMIQTTNCSWGMSWDIVTDDMGTPTRSEAYKIRKLRNKEGRKARSFPHRNPKVTRTDASHKVKATTRQTKVVRRLHKIGMHSVCASWKKNWLFHFKKLKLSLGKLPTAYKKNVLAKGIFILIRYIFTKLSLYTPTILSSYRITDFHVEGWS